MKKDKAKDALAKALCSLSSAAYWIVEGGEFAHWLLDKEMPLAAAKELEDLRLAIVKVEKLLTKLEK